MKWLRPAVVLFILFAIAFLAGVGASAQLLPERVATHFNLAGDPDGWMTRTSYVLFTCAFGAGMPVLMIGMFVLSTMLPDWMVNLPHKEFWLSPAMRPHTNEWLIEHGFWLACLMIALFAGLHVLTVMANRSMPVRLPPEHSTSLMAAFLVLLALWIFRLLRHFRSPGKLGSAALRFRQWEETS